MSKPSPRDSSSPVYFWRETERPYGFMSQWYLSNFTHEGVTYTSAEMWMMAQKAKLFGDEESAAKILKTESPRAQQGLGRKVKGYKGEVWDENKDRIVEEGSWWKFQADPELKKQLLATGDRQLVEASPYDRIWGIGFTGKDAEANRQNWGENRLGKALMAVRERLRQE